MKKRCFILFILVILCGCQTLLANDPYFIYWPEPPRKLYIDSRCESLSIRTTEDKPPVECCAPGDSKTAPTCFPCSFDYQRRTNGQIQISPSVYNVEISGDATYGLVLYSSPTNYIYIPERKLTPEVQKEFPWIRAINHNMHREEGRFIGIVFIARRCLERDKMSFSETSPGKCLRWGEEEEFEQGFYCDFLELRSREKLNLDLADN